MKSSSSNNGSSQSVVQSDPVTLPAPVQQFPPAQQETRAPPVQQIPPIPEVKQAGMSFCYRFLALFGVCTRKRLTVAQALSGGQWTRHLRGNLTPQAVREFTALWMQLQDVRLGQQPDAVSWRWTANGEFSTHSAYAVQFEGSVRTSYKQLIWQSEAPLKCKVFSWMAVLGKILTGDNLAKRN